MKIISCSVNILNSPYKDLIGKDAVVENEEFVLVERNGKKRKYKLNWNTWELQLNNLTMQVKF